MKDMTLREVCSTYGVTRRAVQGYEKMNLVSCSGKMPNGTLLYDTCAQQRIRLIKQYQLFGFRIKEIQNLLQISNEQLKEELVKKRLELHQSKAQLDCAIEMITEMIDQL